MITNSGAEVNRDILFFSDSAHIISTGNRVSRNVCLKQILFHWQLKIPKP